MKRNKHVILIAVVILVTSMLACGESNDATPYPTYTPYPTLTPEPTSATSTPLPAPESESLAEYSSTMMPLMARYSEAFFALGDLSSVPEFDDDGFAPSWKAKMAPILAEILLVGAEIREVQPPPQLEEVHSLLVEATYHYDAGVYLLAEGIDSLDISLIDQAGEEIQLGNQLLEDSTKMMDTIEIKMDA